MRSAITFFQGITRRLSGQRLHIGPRLDPKRFPGIVKISGLTRANGRVGPEDRDTMSVCD